MFVSDQSPSRWVLTRNNAVLYGVNMARARHPKKDVEAGPSRARGSRMDRHPYIVRSPLGCCPLRRSQPIRLSSVDLVNASESGQSRPATPSDSRALPA